MPARVLLIDDDRGLSEVIELLLSREGYGVERAGTLRAGIARSGAAGIDLVITDLKLPDGTGLDAIREIRGVHPALPIIMITSYSSMESAIGALRAGAVDYIIKPFDNDELLHAVARALNERRIARENAVLKRNLKSTYGAWPIVGESPGIRRVLELIRKAAPTDANVLISGESGTGKELAAAALHYASPRAEGPFISVQCGALARDAQETELFGHAPRTGERREGLIREAGGGTLFLDEIAELAPAVQVKLLHLLEEKSAQPPSGADVRTGRDLAEVAPALPMVRAAVPLPGGARPLAIEEYIREVIERFQDSHSETELARMLGIGRKALWMRRRQWGLKRTRKDVSR